MGRFMLLLLLVLFTIHLLYAGQIAAPPPLPSEDTAELSQSVQLYLRSLYDNFHNETIVTANPNGSRRGRRGDTVVATFGGTERFCWNTSTGPSEGTTWVCATGSAP